MKLKFEIVSHDNLENIKFVINDSYNITNFLIRSIYNLMYFNDLLSNEALFLYDDNMEIIGIVIYKIRKYDTFNILEILELCVRNKYKSNGCSKILLKNLLLNIKKKYKECYLSSIVCNLKSASDLLNKYDIVYPKKNLSSLDKKIFTETKKNLIKWYMICNSNGIVFIPFYKNQDTYDFYKSNKYTLNKKQQMIKKFLQKNKSDMGCGYGILNIIKIC